MHGLSAPSAVPREYASSSVCKPQNAIVGTVVYKRKKRTYERWQGPSSSPGLVVSLVALASCQPLPVIFPVTKDAATSLYTIPYSGPRESLVVDIDGPLVWSSLCGSTRKFPCESSTCRLANAYGVPGCLTSAGCGHAARCTAYPYNPVNGRCAAGSLAHHRLVANTTDGSNTVSEVSVNAVSACGNRTLLQTLPRGALGVAGLADSGLALTAQVASALKVTNKFLLCLSRGGVYGDGVAIFGGGPLHFTAVPETDYTQLLDYTPLVNKRFSTAYFVTVKYIALDNLMNSFRVPLPALALPAGGVVLRTTVPYTMLHRDVYGPFVKAFRGAMTKNAREVTPPVAPFELCYDSRTIPSGLSGYLVPSVTLALDGGKNWTMLGENSMVDANPRSRTACLAFVEMISVNSKKKNAPAVIVGGYQMDNFVLQFDLEKKRLGFFRLPGYSNCGTFNFTRNA